MQTTKCMDELHDWYYMCVFIIPSSKTMICHWLKDGHVTININMLPGTSSI